MKIQNWYYTDKVHNFALGNLYSAVADSATVHNYNVIEPGSLGVVFVKHKDHVFGQAIKIVAPSLQSPQDIWGDDWEYIYDISLLSPIKSVNHLVTVSAFKGAGTNIPEDLREAAFTYLV